MQPRDSGVANPLGLTREDKVRGLLAEPQFFKFINPLRYIFIFNGQIKGILDEILEKIPEEFVMLDLNAKVPPEERTPYITVALQECERMNLLTSEIKRSLKELDLGLKV